MPVYHQAKELARSRNYKKRKIISSVRLLCEKRPGKCNWRYLLEACNLCYKSDWGGKFLPLNNKRVRVIASFPVPAGALDATLCVFSTGSVISTGSGWGRKQPNSREPGILLFVQ